MGTMTTTSAAAVTADNAEVSALLARIAALEAEAAARKVAKALSFKVSEKGAVSVYGMGRFPVTLYGEQWERLFAHGNELQAFIKANHAGLKVKETTVAVAKAAEKGVKAAF